MKIQGYLGIRVPPNVGISWFEIQGVSGFASLSISQEPRGLSALASLLASHLHLLRKSIARAGCVRGAQ